MTEATERPETHPRIALMDALVGHLQAFQLTDEGQASPLGQSQITQEFRPADGELGSGLGSNDEDAALIVRVGSFRKNHEANFLVPLYLTPLQVDVRVFSLKKGAEGDFDDLAHKVHEIGNAACLSLNKFIGSESWRSFSSNRFSKGELSLERDSFHARTLEGGDQLHILEMGYDLFLEKLMED